MTHKSKTGSTEHDHCFFDDKGAENFTWPDGGQTRFAAAREQGWRGGSECLEHPVAGQGAGGTIENGVVSGLDWFPTFVAAAGDPDIADELKKERVGRSHHKVHLDGYDQTDRLTGKGPSKRHQIFYITERCCLRCGLVTLSIALPTSRTAGLAPR